MFRVLPTIIAISLIAACGLLQRYWIGRVSDEEVLREAASRLALIPSVAGDWDGHDLTMDSREFKQTEANGVLQRRYVHRRSGETVMMTLLCGRPGPICVHTPEVCFPGAGFEEQGVGSKYSVPGENDAQFWVRRFQKQAAVSEQWRILYSWTSNGNWQAADSPRLAFAGRPVLYKLYLMRRLSTAKEPLDADPTLNLLGALRPQLRAAFSNDPPRTVGS